MTSISARIGALVAAAGSAAALVLAAAGPAGAATGPAVASFEQAGYTATGAHFRYVQESFKLPDASTFASEIGKFGLSVHLWSVHSVIVLGVSNANTTTGGNYSAAASVFNPTTKTLVCSTASGSTKVCAGTPANWNDGTVPLAPGDQITESIYYGRTAGTTAFTVTDLTSKKTLTYTRVAGKGILWVQARVGAEFACTPWGGCSVTYHHPASPVTLASITGVGLTTYSGHRAGVRSWWTDSKIEWTSDGKTTSKIRGKALDLTSGGTAFNVVLEP